YLSSVTECQMFQSQTPILFLLSILRHCIDRAINVTNRRNMVNFAACSAPPTDCIVLNQESNTDCHWLRHSRAVDALWRPASTIGELVELGVNCGPVAFAALAQLQLETAIRYFPDSVERPWTN